MTYSGMNCNVRVVLVRGVCFHSGKEQRYLEAGATIEKVNFHMSSLSHQLGRLFKKPAHHLILLTS